MSFEVHPTATATVTLPTPVITVPGATIFSSNFDSWPAALTYSKFSYWNATGVGGGRGAEWDRSSLGAGTDAVGTLTGLIPGRQYRLTVSVKVNTVGPTFYMSTYGGASTATAPTTAYLPRSFTFTAGSATQTLTFGTGGAIKLYLDDISLELLPVTSTTASLSLAAGDLSLDKSRVPFGSASVTVPLQDISLVEQLNPFANPRVKIKASARGAWTMTPATYSAWTTVATNLAKNPRVGAGSATVPTGYTADGTVLSVSRVDGAAFGTQYAARWTRNTTAAGSYRMAAGSSNSVFVAGQTYTVMVSIQSSVAKTYSMFMRPSVSTSTNQITLPSISADAGVVHNIRRTFVATGTSYGLALTASGAVGETLDATKVAFVEGEYTGPWFDGATENTELTQTAWTGTVNGSASISQARTITQAPAPVWVPADEREFNLVMSSREVSHDGKTVSMRLDTDEAILQRYAPLSDDLGAFDRQDSLRSIINYVLGKAIPGAALQPGGATDRPFRVLNDAQNMIPNPRVIGTGGFSTSAVSMLNETVFPGPQNGIETRGIHLYDPANTSGFADLGGSGMMYGIQAGRTYTFSATGSVRSTWAGGGRTLQLWFWNGAWQAVESAPISTVVNGSTRVSVTATLPYNTTDMRLRFMHGGSSGTISWVMPRLTETHTYPGTHNSEYFTGYGPNTSEYAYSWTGSADNSASRRVALINRAPELLAWKAGTSAWSFLETLKNAAGLRLFCDEQRRWWLVDRAEFDVPGRINVTVSNAAQGTDTMDASGEDAVNGVIARFTWRDNDGNSVTRDDFAGTAGRVRVVEFDRPYPGPGTAAAILVKLTGAGRQQAVTVGADLSVTPAQEISITLPGTLDQLGELQAVTWNLTDGVMDLEASGLTEVTPGSWLAQTEDRTWANRPDTTIWQNASDS